MKLGIMQPYFFPYIGYFQLIQSVDRYILFDTPQYEKRSWMNRNRIINLKEGTTYLTVGTVKAPQKTPLNEIVLVNDDVWKEKILGQLEIYKKLAPHYQVVIDLVCEVLSQKCETLVELNRLSLQKTCDYLCIKREMELFSELELDTPTTCEPDEWALHITKALGYKTYINAPGGEAFFDQSKYEKEGIKLQFLQPQLTPYVQRIGRWEPGLSIIDVMMFNSVEEIQKMLIQYELK